MDEQGLGLCRKIHPPSLQGMNYESLATCSLCLFSGNQATFVVFGPLLGTKIEGYLMIFTPVFFLIIKMRILGIWYLILIENYSERGCC